LYRLRRLVSTYVLSCFARIGGYQKRSNNRSKLIEHMLCCFRVHTVWRNTPHLPSSPDCYTCITITSTGRVKDRNNFKVMGRGGEVRCIDKNERRMTLHGGSNFESVSTTFVFDCDSKLCGQKCLLVSIYDKLTKHSATLQC